MPDFVTVLEMHLTTEQSADGEAEAIEGAWLEAHAIAEAIAAEHGCAVEPVAVRVVAE